MLKSNLCYPYPILRNESIDYKTAVFNVRINKEIDNSSYTFKCEYTISSDYINKLVEEGKAKVGVIIKSNAVWFRNFYDITYNNTITIDSRDIYGRVYILPCIVATTNIDNFYSNEFDEEFRMTNIKINAGEIIGLSDELVFDAILDSDIFKTSSSIFDIIGTDDEYMSYDLSQSKIVIMIPRDIHDKYKSMENSSMQPAPILNSIVVFPVLVEVLEQMKNNIDEFDESYNKWYTTIKKNIDSKRKGGKIKGLDINGDIDDPYLVAQSLTSGLLYTSCERLGNMIINDGGDE